MCYYVFSFHMVCFIICEAFSSITFFLVFEDVLLLIKLESFQLMLA